MDQIIEINELNFSYDASQSPVLKDISFSVERGEWLAIIGPNGSGKSTLAKMINGLLEPESGTIVVNQTPLTPDTVWDIRRHVGMVFQNPDNQFVGATVEDDIAFGLENHGIPRAEMIGRVKEALETVGMEKFYAHEPAKLSGGQKQRVAIAGVYALRPDVIILDEATAMLDPQGRNEVMQVMDQLREHYQLTILSITHDIEEATRADRILVLNQGEIKRIAPPRELFQEPEALLEMGLDVPFATKVAKHLRDKGLTLPDDYLSEEELIEWIHQFDSTM